MEVISMRLGRSFVGALTGAILFIGAFILGGVATVTIGVAGEPGTVYRACNEYFCPEGYRHPDWDANRREYACRPHPGRNGWWECYEEQGSVTSDQGYGVSPNYKCWKSCMKGRSMAMADKAICTAKCKSVPH
jgi:hypothetical protein